MKVGCDSFRVERVLRIWQLQLHLSSALLMSGIRPGRNLGTKTFRHCSSEPTVAVIEDARILYLKKQLNIRRLNRVRTP